MTKEQAQGYSQYNQIQIDGVSLYREGWKVEDYLDIKFMVQEINLYEDMFSPTISANMVLHDLNNILDKFPILGGERVLMRFKTPTMEDEIVQEFVIYRITNRTSSIKERAQAYVVNLCTVDRYNDANIDVSKAFSGSYTQILKGIMALLKTTKPIDADESTGKQKFIVPFWSPLKTARFIAGRAMGDKFEPFFFYEELGGYRFKSSKNIYQAESVAKYYIEMQQSMGLFTDPERSLYGITQYEIIDGNNKLDMFADALFGAKVYQYNFKDKTLSLKDYDYTTMFDSPDSAKIEKFPIFDDMRGKHEKRLFQFEKFDNSHLGAYYRKMVFGMLASYGLRVAIKGNSSLRAGMIIDLDIPSQSAQGGEPVIEKVTSGRWLITSLKHVLKPDSYSMVLELSKDSYAMNVGALVTTGGTKNG